MATNDAASQALPAERPDAPTGPAHSSLRAQTLVPFGVGLVVILALIGICTTLIARSSVNKELKARGQSAARMLDRTLASTRDRLVVDAERVAVEFPRVNQRERAARLELENRVVTLATERNLALTAISQRTSSLVDGRDQWRRLPFARRLLEQAAARGEPAAGSGISKRGEPFVMAAAVGEGGDHRVLVGTAIDQRLLNEVEAPLGVLLHINTRRGGATRADGSLDTVSIPIKLTDGSTPRLEVTVSSRPLARATRSALVTAAGVGLLMALLLIGLLAVLLRRSVIDPLGALRRGIERMKGGDYGVRLNLAGPTEMRSVSEGFNRMCALVGDQQHRLQTLATTDSLTGLANYRTFHDALATAAKSNAHSRAPFALVIIDLDNFKDFNDKWGHPAGDEVLRQTAKHLLNVVRESDVVGRIGGEEFGMLLAAADAESAFQVAERARESIKQIEVADFAVDASAGIATCPDDAREGTRLVELADAALYQAKLAGRSRTCHFDPRVSGPGAVEERQAIVREMLDDPNALRSVFQPVAELKFGTVVGYEALTRFPADSGMGPAEWFDLARTCGLGPQLQAQALARALSVPGCPPGKWLSVNVDPTVLSDPAVQAVLPEDLRGIVIELTEQELPSDDRSLQRDLTELRERGALIALDDAGAGYAGLSHVVRVRADIIKLDRSLVADVHRDRIRFALLSAFVSFARETGAQVCAEGIETHEQLAALVAAEVMLGQGYGLARPVPAWTGISRDLADRMAGWVGGPVPPSPPLPTSSHGSNGAHPKNGQPNGTARSSIRDSGR